MANKAVTRTIKAGICDNKITHHTSAFKHVADLIKNNIFILQPPNLNLMK